ncbi:hypothetical protein PO878_18540 [Iamia majanohamensis]|uniref:Fibronectin type-III domain-containing protein n=1 Tax=Iamia majanohamensis TaxID=467976 RepID=A0AAE9Y4Y5_9ACTN|nr:hypothetical protein [Iamia majanohamensis]WCO66499.1 hypothetical protein PO878_18540 [Iamia majanohamensis]
MTPRSRCRLAAATAAVLAAVVALLLTPAPAAGAPQGLWTLTIDAFPEVVDSRPVVVAGAARGPLGGLTPVSRVTARMAPTGALPEACPPVQASAAPSGDRYRIELVPVCNGPYRVVVTATSSNPVAGPSGDAARPVAVADPGPAPAAPRVVGSADGVALAWAATRAPDVVGWTVVRTGGGSTELPVAAITLAQGAAPGLHAYRLVARRWGAEGPGGPQVASPPSAEARAQVPRTAAPVLPPPSSGTIEPPAAPAPPRPTPARPAPPPTAPRATTTVDPPTRVGRGSGAGGYDTDLPYGTPDDAFVPGERADAAGAPGDDEAAGTSPSARLVTTQEPTSPGLVAPAAIGLLMLTVALHLAGYLRRSRAAADG